MSTAADRILVWAVAKNRGPLTLSEYQLKSRELLLALRKTHSAFGRLATIGTKEIREIPDNLAALDEVIAWQAFDEDHPEDYLNLQPTGVLGPNSCSEIGFSVSYCSFADAGALLPVERGGVELTPRGLSAGPGGSSSLTIKLSPDVHGGFREPQRIRRILQLSLDVWECTFGGVSRSNYEQSVKENAPASYAGQWLFYLPFPHLAKCLPADIRHEPFANGILIETTPHLPDANNPADVAAGKRVRDVLDEFGLVNDATYAIEGWPPDREESLYEQFISGAPAGRKYTVHCVNFDGYDPDRKVLLYAKLFRRLRRHPKEWGFRGWDGPVLNEAKRQVRAAAKAGGVPIEWHIGLEEPAHQVRQLLADYTNITEQQLRVIHTPLEEALKSPPP